MSTATLKQRRTSGIALGVQSNLDQSEPKHTDPTLSGILHVISSLPLETIAPLATILRLALKNDEISKCIIAEVFSNEQCLSECADVSGRYSPDVYFWNGLSNSLQLQEVQL